MDTDSVVYGERVGDLLPGLLKFKDGLQIQPDGSYLFTAALTPSEAGPVRRALMRVEAERLCEEADRTDEADSFGDQAPEERRADAFVRLVQALAR